MQAAAAKEGQDWEARSLRTTSLLARLNRTLREMADRIVRFHSDDGVDARVYLRLIQAGDIFIAQGSDWVDVVGDALAAA